MGKVNIDHIKEAYRVAKQFYHDDDYTLTQAKEELVSHGMKAATAQDMVYIFKSLMLGERYTRAMSLLAIDYYLQHIFNDFGAQGLKNALHAHALHIPYLEETSGTSLHGQRAVHDKYTNLLNEDPDEIEQQEILTYTQDHDIAKLLNQVTAQSPELVEINGKQYKRDNHTIALIKQYRDFKCQICGEKILKRDGSYYIEAAHIKPKHKKGSELPENILILCPNHHKEFDFGETQIISHSSEVVEFEMNGKLYSISLSIV